MDDRELLRAYVERQSEAAFAELVARHVRMVYAIALRRLREPQAAEDVAQSVFILLARKAWSVRDGGALPGWLYRAACHAALRAHVSEQRRRTRETEAMKLAEQHNDATSVAWEKYAPILDEAIQGLKRVDQDALVLRYFQNKSVKETAGALALSEAAAQKRLSRALEKLRHHFARRGVVTTGALLGETLLANAAEAEPAGLAARVKAASAKASATMGLGGIAWRIFMMTNRTKILAAAALVLVAGLITLSLPSWHASSIPKNEAPSDSAPKPVEVAPPVVTIAPMPVWADRDQPSSGVYQPPRPAPPPSAPPGPAGPGGSGGPGPGGPNGVAVDPATRNRNLYGNLFRKLQFTSGQEDMFVKIITDRNAQSNDVRAAATNKLGEKDFAKLIENASKQADLSNPNLIGSNYLSKSISDQLGITPQLSAIDAESASQLRQLLGSEENYQYYQNYAHQFEVRLWVTKTYGNALQEAGVEDLTVDQQETLVGIVAQSIRSGEVSMHVTHISEVLANAAAFLTPAQLAVLSRNPNGFVMTYARLHLSP